MSDMGAGKNKRHIIIRVLFAVYFLGLLYFLFFSDAMGRGFVRSGYRYNLTPFLEIRRFIRYRSLLGNKAVFLNVYGNIVAFMPFGFFLPILLKKRNHSLCILLYSFEFSIFIELLQLVTKLGSCDVDDVILNTTGGTLGYLVYRIIVKKRRRVEHDPKGKQKT